MGGLGSGNKQQSGRLTVGQCLQLDVEKLKLHGVFEESATWTWRWTNGNAVQISTSEPGWLRLGYQADEKTFEYRIRIETIPQHFGGARRWFRCPNTKCARRCRTVYFRQGYFLCRKCQRLGYLTEQASKSDYPYHQINKVRRRLGWVPGYLNGHETKPKGMHWKTYDRLIQKHRVYEHILNTELESFFCRLRGEK